MTIWVLLLTMMIGGCAALQPSVVCKDGHLYARQGMTTVYTETVMTCIDTRDYK